jgi:hypothetical protein
MLENPPESFGNRKQIQWKLQKKLLVSRIRCHRGSLHGIILVDGCKFALENISVSLSILTTISNWFLTK